MAEPDGELTVAQRLGRALDRGLLPAGGPAEAAERLIERLERSARVALLGLPGSGKSSILNLLVGAVVVPETLRLPTIIVQHGDVARMICTLTDGTTKLLPGHDLAEVLPLAPALVTLEMDLPALKVISLLEVSAGPMEAEQKRAATWASKRADIVIWCSTSYLPKEQAVWESLPDSVKDNSFMFLTKVDLLGNRESATAMHDRVELRAGEEFRQILSISAKQARAAMPPGGAVNRELFRDSGASGVIAAIKTRVQSGRRADMDTAELLLARHVEASEFVARRFAEPGEETEAPKSWTPPPEPEPQAEMPAAASAPVAESGDDGQAEALPEVAAVEPEAEAVVASDAVEDQDAGSETVAEAVALPEAEAPAPVAADPVPEPAMESPSRRRFADRIKRVATDGEAAATPMVPLKSTWKSKAEVEAAPEPEPTPEVRPTEPARRPRAQTQPVAEEAEDLARTVAKVVSAPDAAFEPAEAAAPEPEAEPEAPAPELAPEPAPAPEPGERRPRAVTPRPERAAAETPRTVRPQLFGGRRAAPEAEAPLPDLSTLRATPEEIAASAEARDQDLAAATPEDMGSAPTASEDDWQEPEPEVPEPEEPAARPVRSARLFDREPRPAAPVTPPRAEPMPRATPVSRSPAPPRVPATPHEPVVTQPVEDEFSPRSIMMRERHVEPDAPAPRRERARITARAQPAAAEPTALAPVTGPEQALVDEALDLILSRSAALEQEIDPDSKVPVDLILDHTRETGELIQAVVARGKSEPLRRINSDLGEVMDLILLMQLERGHAPADDALTLILQLRRELETLRAV